MKIVYTKNWEEFAFVIENRDVNDKKVEKLSESIKELGYQICPIVVTDKMNGKGLVDINDEDVHGSDKRYVVIDGQHRLEACISLDIEAVIVINEDATRDDIVTANNTGSKWTKNDYINFYKEKGNIDYEFLSTYVKKHKKEGFGLNAIAEAYQSSGDIVKGTYVIDHQKGAKVLTNAYMLKSILPGPKMYKEAKLIRALMNIYARYPQMDGVVLAEQLKNVKNFQLVHIPAKDSQTLLDAYANSFDVSDKRMDREIRDFIVAYYNGRCNYTGCSAEANHADHVKPWSRDGETSINNLQLLCESCNKSKGAKDENTL